MIRQFTLCVFVLLAISLTRHSHVAGTGIEILGSGVRPVGGGMTGPESLPEDMNEPQRGELGISGGGSNENRNAEPPNMGPGTSGHQSGLWGSSVEGGGDGGEPPGIGTGMGGSQLGPVGGDSEGATASNGMNSGGGGGNVGMPASLGLGPDGAPLGTNNLEGGGFEEGGPIGFGLGAGGPFGSGGGGFGGAGDGSPLARLAAGFRGSSLGSRGGNMEGSGGGGAPTGFGGGFGGPMLDSRSGGLEGSVASGSNEQGAGREGGGASSNLGPGFPGSSFVSGGGNLEGGGISGEPRPAPGGFSGSGSDNGGGGFGGAGFSGAGFSGGRFGSGEFGGGRGGGGGGFGTTTSNGGYGGSNMPLQLPPRRGTPEQEPTSRQSSEENGEGEGEGGGGSGSREGTSSPRRRTFTGLLNMNALRSIVGAGPGAIVGTGVSLLQGTRTGRRMQRRGRRILIRLTRQRERVSRTLGERGNRRRRSVPLNVKAPPSTASPNFIDYVPDHVKMIHCGHNEVPNRGHYKDRFCHPETTWKTVMRMRPDCVCAPGYIRNSWGDCISYAECYHCMDKHHLNMDYNLCESQCPLVCNQPLDRSCPDTCYEECACRPGYIRSHRKGPCISIKQCLPGCPSRNQNFSLCLSPCPATCAHPFPSNCPKFCAGEGCACKPGFLALHLEPLVCVRPEQCPEFSGMCHGKNQVYTTCMSRCPATCWDKEPRVCAAVCSGTGCVCKPGFVIAGSNPLVCVHPTQCAAFKNTSNFIKTKKL